MTSAPVLAVDGLVKHFPGHGGQTVHAVNGVSFTIAAGETLGLVGESGSGKSTIGRTAIRLLQPTGGRILFKGQDISRLPERACRKLRADMQMVFQDPWSALNPRLKVGSLIEETLVLHTTLSAAQRRDKTVALAERVRLSPELLTRFPADRLELVV